MNSDLKQLSVDERIRLVEDLWDSIAADQLALALRPDQVAELDRRLASYEADGLEGRAANEVMTELRQRL